MGRISSADYFISGFTASQSPQLRLRSIVGYTLLNTLSFASHFPQSFSLRYALKNTLKKTFSTCIRLHFSPSFILFYFQFLFLRVHKRQIISLPYMDISKPFCGGVLQKFFLSHYNWKVPRRLSGYFTKILQKNCREIFPTTACKKEVRLYQTSFYAINFLIVFYFLL